MSHKEITRIHGHEFCTLQVEISDRKGIKRFTICGEHGEVMTLAQARRYTIEFWESYFEEGGEAKERMLSMGCRTPRGAAKRILETDGLLGDMRESSDGKRVFYVMSCGQIREDISLFFPESVPYFRWHLNDMHAECVHQEARGETYQTHPDAVCGDCGYKLGSAWTMRELPAEVLEWFDSLESNSK